MTLTTDVIVIGAGQAGLAMSHCLSELGLDHLVLDRGAIAERWRNERWASLRLLSPNWMTRLPGFSYTGPSLTGFMSRDEVTAFLKRYARYSGAPVREYCEVLAVTRQDGLFTVETTDGILRALAVVLATGACDVPRVPEMAAGLSAAIRQVTPREYLHADQLPQGGALVVGGSATGIQLAEEIHCSGRPVTLAMGSHAMLPRRYRGRDIMRWMDLAGVLSEARDPAMPPERALAQPSLQLVGSMPPRDINVASLVDIGVRLVGRVTGAEGQTVGFGDNLSEDIARAGRRRDRILDRIDAFVAGHSMNAPLEERPPLPRIAQGPASIDLGAEGIRTVVWATGYERHYPWLRLPVLDASGELRQVGGVTPVPGLYALGLPYMRRRNSATIDGVGADARAITRHLAVHLGLKAPQAA